MRYLEYSTYAKRLERHHYLFNMFWKLGRPLFCNSIPTACIAFDKKTGHYNFLFNEDYWNSLDFYSKTFVISHECMHVMLNHLKRTIDAPENLQRVINSVLDVVVNETLCSKFGFEREKLGELGKNGCWLDTVFPEGGVKADEQFEYYYNKIKEKITYIEVPTLDVHDFLSEDEAEELLDSVVEQCGKEEMEDLKKLLKKHGDKEAGKQKGVRQTVVDWEYIRPKPKWETIISNFVRNKIKEMESLRWDRRQRRMEGLLMEFSIPSYLDCDIEYPDKVDMLFGLDYSGSCVGLESRFIKAARSIPEDKFNVMPFSFDTKIYPINLKTGEIHGGGGTNASVIEHKCQELFRYPQAVFVFTDGYFSNFTPQHPERWHWFLTEDGTKGAIPKGSKTYELKDFE